ncbi:hypothetical protein QBC43DRAFT_304180 [Cladorrhinum sp. PSN259]|nr:hypothetical protein QBC43DRAFT_304180 [Cladorrhinum sp. PSN259]
MDFVTPEEKHKTSPRRSLRESSEQRITFEGPLSQTANPNTSADIYEQRITFEGPLSQTANPNTSADIYEQRFPFEGPLSQTADPNASADIYASSAAASKGSSNQQGGCRPRCGPGVQKPKVKQRAASPSPSATSPQSSPPPQSSRTTSRLPYHDTQSRSSSSRPSSNEIIEISSDDSEPELGPSTAQTTLSPSPSQTTPSPSPAPTTLSPPPVQRKNETPSDKARAVRPTSEPRTASAPGSLTGSSGISSDTKVKRAQDIDGDIEKQIRQPKKLSKRDKELGYVYVVPACINGKEVIKIGYTAETSVDTRLKAIATGGCESTIKILELPSTSPEHTQVHLFYEKVEKLAHMELANFRYNFSCGCSKKHNEFFVVDEEIGHMVVERWARLCALRPFKFHKDHWVLKDEWKFYLDRFRERNHGRLGKKHEKKDDHISRHQRWESFLDSKRSAWYVHSTVVWVGKIWARRWQMASSVLAVLLRNGRETGGKTESRNERNKGDHASLELVILLHC